MLKKFSIGSWIACGTFVLSFVSMIIYLVGVTIEGYFQGEVVTGTLLLLIFSMLALIGVVAYSLFAPANKYADMAVSVVKAGIALMLSFAAMLLLNARVEGFAYIYFSNADVLATIQTPANLASASTSIVAIVFIFVAAIAMIVDCFFSLRKEEVLLAAE